MPISDQLPGAGAVALLVKLLRDPAAAIRVNAALALGELRAKEAEESLLAALKDEARPVQIAAARALGVVAGRSGIDALAALARGPADPALRLEAVRALGAIYLGYCGNAAGRPGARKPPATAASFRPEDAAGAEVIFQVLSRTLSDPLTELHTPSIEALARTPAGAGKVGDEIRIASSGVRAVGCWLPPARQSTRTSSLAPTCCRGCAAGKRAWTWARWRASGAQHGLARESWRTKKGRKGWA
jgi:hypothetical protein